MLCVPSRVSETIELTGYRRAATARRSARPARRGTKSLCVETAADVARQSRPQGGDGRALSVFRARLLSSLVCRYLAERPKARADFF
jgi:hypothetical protein